MNKRLATFFCMSLAAALGLSAQPLKRLTVDLSSDIVAVRVHAVQKLGEVRSPESERLLAGALSDTSPEVRLQSAQALGNIKGHGAVKQLVASLGDSDVSVRKAAAHALGEIKDPASMDALMVALGDSEYVVRDEVAWALREIGGKDLASRLVALLKQADADVPHLQWLLSHADGAAAVPELVALMADPDVSTRLRAGGVLAKMKTQESTSALIKVLDDDSPQVRLLATNALASRADERAEVPLRKRLKVEGDEQVKEALALAVRRYSKEDKLSAHWSFDDRSTSVAKDVTGKGTDGEIKGCKPVAGKMGHALQFGPEMYVEFGKPTALKIGGRDFTVMAWARTDQANGVVVARGGAFCGYSLYIMEGKAKFGIHRVQDGPAYIAVGSSVPMGEWFHISGIVKEKSVEVYVNGKLVGKAETDGHIPGECGQGMEIGFDAGNSACEIVDPFVGILDEVRVYGVALTEKDLSTIYNAQK